MIGSICGHDKVIRLVLIAFCQWEMHEQKRVFVLLLIGVPYEIATGGRAKICPESAIAKPGGHVWSLLKAPRPDIF